MWATASASHRDAPSHGCLARDSWMREGQPWAVVRATFFSASGGSEWRSASRTATGRCAPERRGWLQPPPSVIPTGAVWGYSLVLTFAILRDARRRDGPASQRGGAVGSERHQHGKRERVFEEAGPSWRRSRRCPRRDPCPGRCPGKSAAKRAKERIAPCRRSKRLSDPRS